MATSLSYREKTLYASLAAELRLAAHTTAARSFFISSLFRFGSFRASAWPHPYESKLLLVVVLDGKKCSSAHLALCADMATNFVLCRCLDRRKLSSGCT